MTHRLLHLKFLLIGLTLTALAACGNSDNETAAAPPCLSDAPLPLALPSGAFLMGAYPAYEEEGPPSRVTLRGFNIDATEVTNAQFARFVDATGYVTDAEKPQAGFDAAGGVVFRMPTLENPSWWHFVKGAYWRAPDGPGSSIAARDHEPVVQVSYHDAAAYAAWAGRRLPSEIEWEYAANAGATTEYVWGAERTVNGQEMANTWQGSFPVQNTNADGYAKRAPVGCFARNDFGLYDMIGNVWEWTVSPANMSGSGSGNGSAEAPSEARYIIKGGSFLCAPNFCRRYRAAARQAQEAGLPTSHIGFRTVSTQ